MKYENPTIPENINTSEEHPFKEFAILLVGAVILILVTTLSLSIAGGWLAEKVPFSTEQQLASSYDIAQHTDNTKHVKLSQYLQSLANEVHTLAKLPKDMPITVHYIDNDTVNAFATLGGHLFLHRGILEKMNSENMLMMLIAHEVAHIKYRHPIKSLGSGITVSLGLSAITGSTDSELLGDTGLLTVLKFSRDMETQSDLEALQVLHKKYGHVAGGVDLFFMFQAVRKTKDQAEAPSFLSTHPFDQKRIDQIKQTAQDKGWAMEGEMAKLPKFYRFQ